MRCCASIIVVVAILITVASSTPPSNCWTPEEVTTSDLVSDSTVGKPTSTGMCNIDFAGEIGAVVYKVTMDVGRDLTVSTCNSRTDYRSAIVVFGYSCDVPVCIGGSYTTQRDCGHAGGTYFTITYSSLFPEVFIMVTGIGEEGSFGLSLSASEPDETWGDCEESPFIEGPGTFLGKVYLDEDEDDGTPACGLQSDVSVEWYNYVPFASNTKVTITTCSIDTEFDTILGVMDAPENLSTPCDAECLEVSDNYDPSADDPEGVTCSTVVYNAQSNAPNRFFVTGKGTGHGEFRVTIKETTVIGPPVCRGTHCGATCATALPAGVGIFVGSVSRVDNYAGDVICGRVNPDDHVLWYEFLPPVAARVTVTTCDRSTTLDTLLAIVSDCDTLGCIAFNDDAPCEHTTSGASTLSVNVQPWTSYYIAVAGFGHSQGDFLLIVDGDLEEPTDD